MVKILKLLADDFHAGNVSAEYKVLQNRFSEVEKPFMDSLDEEQKKEYLKLDSVQAELQSQEFNDFAKYLLENLKAVLTRS